MGLYGTAGCPCRCVCVCGCGGLYGTAGCPGVDVCVCERHPRNASHKYESSIVLTLPTMSSLSAPQFFVWAHGSLSDFWPFLEGTATRARVLLTCTITHSTGRPNLRSWLLDFWYTMWEIEILEEDRYRSNMGFASSEGYQILDTLASPFYNRYHRTLRPSHNPLSSTLTTSVVAISSPTTSQPTMTTGNSANPSPLTKNGRHFA